MPEKQNWKFKRKGQRICYFPHFLLITELSTLPHLLHIECVLFDKHTSWNQTNDAGKWIVLAEHLPRYSMCFSFVSFVWVGRSTVSFSGFFSIFGYVFAFSSLCRNRYVVAWMSKVLPSVPNSSDIYSVRTPGHEEDGHRCFRKALD